MVIDIYEELYGNNEVSILFEGAQGFELDIDWGDYPYVTSSHCTTGAVCLNGIPPQKIRKIYDDNHR
jgi:adenylosuccinate synthase